MKKSLSVAFSTKTLVEQEHIVVKFIDDLIARIGEDGGPGTGGVNMTKWYDMCAFDIVGEMAFGESFHCIESGALGKPPSFLSHFLLTFFFFSLAGSRNATGPSQENPITGGSRFNFSVSDILQRFLAMKPPYSGGFPPSFGSHIHIRTSHD